MCRGRQLTWRMLAIENRSVKGLAEVKMNENSSGASIASPPRFCSDCGRSLWPLDQIHVSRECEECGKAVYLVERGADGRGINVRAGDRLSLPPGAIKISLDPASGSRLFRPGLALLLNQRILSGSPSEPASVRDLLSSYQAEVEAILKASNLSRDIDLDSASAAEELAARFKNKERTWEWWALVMGASCEAALEALATESPNYQIESVPSGVPTSKYCATGHCWWTSGAPATSPGIRAWFKR